MSPHQVTVIDVMEMKLQEYSSMQKNKRTIGLFIEILDDFCKRLLLPEQLDLQQTFNPKDATDKRGALHPNGIDKLAQPLQEFFESDEKHAIYKP